MLQRVGVDHEPMESRKPIIAELAREQVFEQRAAAFGSCG